MNLFVSLRIEASALCGLFLSSARSPGSDPMVQKSQTNRNSSSPKGGSMCSGKRFEGLLVGFRPILCFVGTSLNTLLKCCLRSVAIDGNWHAKNDLGRCGGCFVVTAM